MDRIRLGMVGGGEGAFIGAVHRIASRIDDRFQLLAGCLSSDPQRSRRSAESCGIQRCYPDFQQMAAAESALKDGIQAVVIATPNHLHCSVARAFIQRGIHVICDKPLSHSMSEARELALMLRSHPQVHFVLTHNYSGYPLVRQMRSMIAEGALGQVWRVDGHYLQDWLMGVKNRDLWRLDPQRSGPVGCLGDIGSHVAHLLEFVLRDRIASVSAQLQCVLQPGGLDDNVQLQLRTSTGVRGWLWASQTSLGHENDLGIAVYGSKGSLRWGQEDPNQLFYSGSGEPTQRLTRNGPRASWENLRCSRLPAGHPEGFLEGFAQIYRDTADLLQGGDSSMRELLPGIEDGLAGMSLFQAALESQQQDGAWVALRPVV